MMTMTYRQYIITGMNNSPRERQMKNLIPKKQYASSPAGSRVMENLVFCLFIRAPLTNMKPPSRWGVCLIWKKKAISTQGFRIPPTTVSPRRSVNWRAGWLPCSPHPDRRLTIMPYLISVRRGIILSFLRLCMEEPLTSSQ